jgi:hypothetical protein
VVKDGWPRHTGSSASSFTYGTPAVYDLDGDEDLEIIVPCATGILYVWHHDGSAYGYRTQVEPDSTIIHIPQEKFFESGSAWSFSSPAVGNVDGEGYPEIVIGFSNGKLYILEGDPDVTDIVYEGWPYEAGEKVTSSPALGDFDDDGDLEIVFCAHDDSIRFMHHTGEMIEGWPVRIGMTQELAPSPAIADVDGDGVLDITACSSQGKVSCWDINGNENDGWPVRLESDVWSSPIVGDIDGDSELEVIIGTMSGKIYALNHDGTLTDGWPVGIGSSIIGTPCLADLDGDQDVEVILAGMDAQVHVWDSPGLFDTEKLPWFTFRQGFERSGTYGHETSTPVELSGFSAFFDGRCVNLSWVISSDDLAGVDILRGKRGARSIEKINHARIEPEVAGFTDCESGLSGWLEYSIRVFEINGKHSVFGPFEVFVEPAPIVSRIDRTYPNPFNPTVRIAFEVGGAGARDVELTIFDVRGSKVATVVQSSMKPGRYKAEWNGTGDAGEAVGSGIYFCALEVDGSLEASTKLVLIK